MNLRSNHRQRRHLGRRTRPGDPCRGHTAQGDPAWLRSQEIPEGVSTRSQRSSPHHGPTAPGRGDIHAQSWTALVSLTRTFRQPPPPPRPPGKEHAHRSLPASSPAIWVLSLKAAPCLPVLSPTGFGRAGCCWGKADASPGRRGLQTRRHPARPLSAQDLPHGLLGSLGLHSLLASRENVNALLLREVNE